ncbi:MAG TPA: sigma-70 family RNA polymerase sigma factor [Tepidisphaeraceae bacterium]|nr:sigma-70 family RNA polymerase sigma factor [Tepidisphaeraceae bacterium]
MTDDARWLKQFVDEGSEDAFERLVRKHVHLVYSAALRQLKDSALAEDVTQLTFIALSQKAQTLRRECALSAWLLVTTRYLCLDTLKASARRQRHEQTAAAMAKAMDQSPRHSDWEEFSPYLDAALASLSPQDRRAITLRYFEGQNFNEVAQTMGTSLDAAKQRVHRATLRMRKFFVARGVNVTASAIGPAITALAVHVAPPHLVASATSAGLAAKTAVATTLSAKGTAVVMASAKTKIIAGAAALLLVGGGAVATWKAVSPPRRQFIVIPPNPLVTSPPEQDWLAAFNARYGLAAGQIVRFVPPPFGPERQAFWDNEQRKNHSPPWKLQNMWITFAWDGQGAHWTSIGGPGDVMHAMRFCARIKEYEIDRSCVAWEMSGDWVARNNAGINEILDGIAGVVAQKAGHPVHFVHRLVQREVIVVRGNYAPTGQLKGGVLLFDHPTGGPTFVWRRNFGDLLNTLGDWMGKKVVNETTTPLKTPVSWSDQFPGRDRLRQVLLTLSDQTSLKCDVEPREIMVWALEDGAAPTTAPQAPQAQ